jgi:tRNA(adenine34) deaminase
MDVIPYSDEWFMREAMREANKARDKGEVPVGAIVVSENKILARAHNLTEALCDVTAHAEMQAITSAANALGAKFLEGCTLYVTLEPCPMCAGAIRWARFQRLVYGATDSKYGFSHIKESLLHPRTLVQGGIMEEACGSILTDFFKERRKR